TLAVKMRLIKKQIMKTINLKGSLALQRHKHVIKIECTGSSIKITFSSFKTLVHFIYFYRPYTCLVQNHLSNFNLAYYLGTKRIAESSPTLPFNRWKHFLS